MQAISYLCPYDIKMTVSERYLRLINPVAAILFVKVVEMYLW
jgi:hypothetical protein